MPFVNQKRQRQKIICQTNDGLREETRYTCISLARHRVDMIDIDTNNCLLYLVSVCCHPLQTVTIYIFQASSKKWKESHQTNLSDKKLKLQIGLAISAAFIQPKLLSYAQACRARTRVHARTRTFAMIADCRLICTIPSLVIKSDTMNLILI